MKLSNVFRFIAVMAGTSLMGQSLGAGEVSGGGSDAGSLFVQAMNRVVMRIEQMDQDVVDTIRLRSTLESMGDIEVVDVLYDQESENREPIPNQEHYYAWVWNGHIQIKPIWQERLKDGDPRGQWDKDVGHELFRAAGYNDDAYRLSIVALRLDQQRSENLLISAHCNRQGLTDDWHLVLNVEGRRYTMKFGEDRHDAKTYCDAARDSVVQFVSDAEELGFEAFQVCGCSAGVMTDRNWYLNCYRVEEGGRVTQPADGLRFRNKANPYAARDACYEQANDIIGWDLYGEFGAVKAKENAASKNSLHAYGYEPTTYGRWTSFWASSSRGSFKSLASDGSELMHSLACINGRSGDSRNAWIEVTRESGSKAKYYFSGGYWKCRDAKEMIAGATKEDPVVLTLTDEYKVTNFGYELEN